jgi:hypothetical protein
MAKLKIDYRPPGDLVLYENNPRTHTTDQVDAIARSIEEFGWAAPVVVDGNGVIIAGHGRVAAARKLGMKAIPCVARADLTEAQAQALRIADNRLAELAGWDYGLLGVEFGELLGAGEFDATLAGFGEAEIGDLTPVPLGEYPDLREGEHGDYQQMNFTLHKNQIPDVTAAIGRAGKVAEAEWNENSRGNALAHICKAYLRANGHG